MEVEARRKLVAVEEEEAGVHTARARQLQEECQAELNQALPALHGECLPLLHSCGCPQISLDAAEYWFMFSHAAEEALKGKINKRIKLPHM